MIYLDNAATTKTAPEVVEAMLPYFTQNFGNASSIYQLANISKKAMEEAREICAKALQCNSNNIYFTAGGTESDNWALKATFEAFSKKGKHIITSKIEHHAILHSCKNLEKMGARITYLDVDGTGKIDLEQLENAITPDTILISIMFANNEIGTIQPMKEIGQIAKKHDIIFHTDAVQAFGQIPISVEEYGIDLLSASSHKMNGPKGIGFLYIRQGLAIGAYFHGGAQERNRRAGTENIPAIVGFGTAVSMAMTNMEAKTKKVMMLRDYLIEQITQKIPFCKLNGHETDRLPGNVNISFEFIEGESLLIMLDMAGICASSGSACTSGSLDPSHVLLAIGLPHEKAHGSLRMTLNEENTIEELDIVINNIVRIVERLRMMSPLYDDFVKKGGKDHV